MRREGVTGSIPLSEPALNDGFWDFGKALTPGFPHHIVALLTLVHEASHRLQPHP